MINIFRRRRPVFTTPPFSTGVAPPPTPKPLGGITVRYGASRRGTASVIRFGPLVKLTVKTKPKSFSVINRIVNAILGKSIKYGPPSKTAPVVPTVTRPKPFIVLHGNNRNRLVKVIQPVKIGPKVPKDTTPVIGWRHIQDQIDAGYPIYIEPTQTAGSYVETFDFGTIYSAVILNINYDFQLIEGSMSIGFSTETSTDGISWTAPNTNLNFFVSSLRYARITVSFLGGNKHSLLEFYNFRVALNVHLENDGGQITANKADAAGTVVTFNKSFKRIVSITLTSKQKHPVTMIYDFSFPANPTTFKVLAFDSSGNRITEDITWAARGII